MKFEDEELHEIVTLGQEEEPKVIEAVEAQENEDIGKKEEMVEENAENTVVEDEKTPVDSEEIKEVPEEKTEKINNDDGMLEEIKEVVNDGGNEEEIQMVEEGMEVEDVAETEPKEIEEQREDAQETDSQVVLDNKNTTEAN